MALKGTGSISVTTTATRLSTAPTDVGSGQAILLKRVGATSTIFLGSATVTASGAGQGYPWAVGDSPISITLEPGEILYGIVASGTETCAALETGT